MAGCQPVQPHSKMFHRLSFSGADNSSTFLVITAQSKVGYLQQLMISPRSQVRRRLRALPKGSKPLTERISGRRTGQRFF